MTFAIWLLLLLISPYGVLNPNPGARHVRLPRVGAQVISACTDFDLLVVRMYQYRMT